MLVVALLLPIGVVLARVAGTDWLLTSDFAGIDLRTVTFSRSTSRSSARTTGTGAIQDH